MIIGQQSEQLWAEHGLTGLVLFALFVLIGVFIRTISVKDAKHTKFTSEMMEASAKERKEIRDDHAKSNERLANAIDNLSSHIRSNRD